MLRRATSATPKPKLSERELLRQVTDFLTVLPQCFAVSVNAMAAFAEHKGKRRRIQSVPPGTADVLCCIRGRWVSIECKAGRNKATAAQDAHQRAVQKAGGIALVVYSLGQLIAALKYEGLMS